MASTGLSSARTKRSIDAERKQQKPRSWWVPKMRIRGHKIRRDLLHNKGRSAAVILAIMVGVFAVGMIINARIILSREMDDSFAATNPMHAFLVTDGIDEQFLRAIERVDGVDRATGAAAFRVRLAVAPDEYVVMPLMALPSYDDIPVNIVKPEEGAWPPPSRSILLERSALPMAQAQIGEILTVTTPDDRQRQLELSGTVYDPSNPPAQFSGMAFGYITFDTLEWLGGERLLTELYITVSEKTDDMAHIQSVADEVQALLERNNIPVRVTYVPIPGVHPVADIVDAVTAVMVILGVVSLLIAAILIFNTMSALLTQQTVQIGIMKSMGADARQLYGMYIAFIIALGLAGTLLAIPLSVVGANLFITFVADLLNFDISSFSVEPAIFGLQLILGLLVPLLGGYWPIRRGVRMTIREALASNSAGADDMQHGWFERLFARINLLSRPMLLAFRNMFRRKGRLFLSLLMLTLGGAIVIAVFSLQSSVAATLDDASRYWQYDIEISLQDYQRSDQIRQQVTSVPGVVGVEDWNTVASRRIRPNGSESDLIEALGVPPSTALMDPILLEGRWLQPTDTYAVVVNSIMLQDEQDLRVGDWLTLKLNGRESEWQIVGVVRGVINNPVVYANNEHFSMAIRKAARTNSLRVVTTEHTPDAQAAVVSALESTLEQRRVNIDMIQSTSDLHEQVSMQFGILVVFLSIMASLIIIVAAIGLAGTMSINVMERISEVGVLRALGASGGAIMRIIIFEGVMSSILSWSFAGLLAWPLSSILSTIMGEALMNAPLTHQFALNGLVIWLVIAILVGVIASILPALRASKLSVREVLSYE